jgi:2-oxoisovalerate dehydrogenase E2 component (dihydrolipoyl transacylase)
MPTEFKMPQLGETVVEGTVARWLKQEGETVDSYEPLLEVETDKVTSEVPSPVSGVILQILVPQGETVSVGTLLCLIGQPGETAAPEPTSEPKPAAPAEANGQDGPANVVSRRRARRDGPPVTPVVARLAAEHNIDLSRVPGTGRGGRISKKDILAYLEQQQAAAPASKPEPGPAPIETPDEEIIPRRTPAAAPAPPPVSHPGQLVPLSGMRQAIAEHMIRSKQTSAHVTTLMEADCSRIWAYRAQHQAEFLGQTGLKLTFTPFFIAATVKALQAVPVVNSRWTDAGIQLIPHINLGIAVALDEGLIVPVIKEADTLNLTGLQRVLADLANRARLNQLKPDEVQGGTFTITNHGMGGSLLATPIINQPQAGILGVGAIEKRVVVITRDGLDTIAIKPMCYLTLTFDHRLLDGATADRFLAIVKREIEGW